MRRILILPLLLLSQLLLAQNAVEAPRKFTYGVEISKLMVTSDSYRDFTKTGTWIKLNMGYNLSQRLSCGVSFGVNTYRDANLLATLPLEAEIKGFLFEKANTPFAIAKAGYSFERPDDGSYGAVWSLGIGYRIKIGRNVRLMPIVGYNHQEIHSYAMVMDYQGFIIDKVKADPLSSIYAGIRFEF